MRVVGQIILVSVYIISVQCHLNYFGIPSIHTLVHGHPERHHRWHHNMFNPAYPNRHPNIYDSGEMGYGNEGPGPIHHNYVPDGTIFSYDKHGPVNGLNDQDIGTNNPNYHNDPNVNGPNGYNDNHGPVDHENISHYTDDNKPTNEGSHQGDSNTENPDFDKPKDFEDNESDDKPDAGKESDVFIEKQKLQEGVFVYQDPKPPVTTDSRFKINTPTTNGGISDGNPSPVPAVPSSNVIQNVPNASPILVPLPSTGGVQTNPVAQIVGTDAATGLQIVNINGALYYYVNPANNQVSTPKPVQIILIPANGQLNPAPTNPNYVILNGNGQFLPVNGQNLPAGTGLPVNNGVNTNVGVNVGDIVSYLQQHPEILQQIRSTASVTPAAPGTFKNPEQGVSIPNNPINVAVGTPSNNPSAGYQPTQNVGPQTNGINPNDLSNAIIALIQQHPEIFGSNAPNYPAPTPNGNAAFNNPNLNANKIPLNVVPSNNGVTANNIQSVIAYISQHPEVFSANAIVSNNVPVTVTNPSNNVRIGGDNQPADTKVNGAVTNVDIIAFLTQHPEIFSANAILPNIPNPANTVNPLPGPEQEGRGSFTPSNEPTGSIGASNNVKVPVDDQGSNTGANRAPTNGGNTDKIIDYLTQHPEIYGPKQDGNKGGSNPPVEDKNNIQNANPQGNINDSNVPRGDLNTYNPTANTLPNGSGGNMPSYMVVDYPGPTTPQPQNNAGTGFPLKTNYNNDNNNNPDTKVTLALSLSDTKDLEGVKFNTKPGGGLDAPRNEVNIMSATKDREDFDEEIEQIIPTTVIPEEETTTE